MPEVRALDDTETLSFLHAAASNSRHAVSVPVTPVYLDAILADTPLTGGLEPAFSLQLVESESGVGLPGTEVALSLLLKALGTSGGLAAAGTAPRESRQAFDPQARLKRRHRLRLADRTAPKSLHGDSCGDF